MTLSFRQFIEQGMPPPGMGGMPGAPMGGMPPGGGQQPMPNWNNLAYELGIEPQDLKGQTFVGSWIGPSGGNLSNLRAFTVKAVDGDGEEIDGMKIDFLPTTKAGTKGLRDLTQGRQGQKWKIVPRGARVTKRIPQYVDFDWFNKVMFQDKDATGGGGGMPGSLPGVGGMPMPAPAQ